MEVGTYQMKLSEIEPVARVDAFEKKANFTNEVRYGGEPLYSEKGMQEYAKAKVFEALGKYGVRDDEWSEHEVGLAHKQMTKFIFEEKEKNE